MAAKIKPVRTNAFMDMDRLRRIYTDDESIAKLDRQETALRQAIEEAKIKDLPAIQTLIRDTEYQIASINHTLMNREDLSDLDRKGLYQMRKVHRFWLHRIIGKKAMQVIKDAEEWAAKEVERG